MDQIWIDLITDHKLTAKQKAKILLQDTNKYFNNKVNYPHNFERIKYIHLENETTIIYKRHPPTKWPAIIYHLEDHNIKVLKVLQDKTINLKQKNKILSEIQKSILKKVFQTFLPSEILYKDKEEMIDIMVQISNRKYTSLFELTAVKIINDGFILQRILDGKYPMSTDVLEHLLEQRFQYINFSLPYETIDKIAMTVLERFHFEQKFKYLDKLIDNKTYYDDYYYDLNQEQEEEQLEQLEQDELD